MSLKASEIWGGLAAMMGGFHKMASVCPGGVNHNAFIVMVRPPGRTWGVNENFSPEVQIFLFSFFEKVR